MQNTRWIPVIFRLLLVAVMVTGLAAVAPADVPLLLSYQGDLRQTDGTPFADGTYMMKFEIFDASSAGSSQWSETYSGGSEVNVEDGLFSVQLGSANALTSGLFSSTTDLWVEVSVDSDGNNTLEGDEIFSPRERLIASPFAIEADLLDGNEASAFATSSHQHDTRYLRLDTNTTQNNGLYVATDQLRARDSDGLALRDSSGSLGLVIADGGNVGVGTSSATSALSLLPTHTTSAEGLSLGNLEYIWRGGPEQINIGSGPNEYITFDTSFSIWGVKINCTGLNSDNIFFDDPVIFLDGKWLRWGDSADYSQRYNGGSYLHMVSIDIDGIGTSGDVWRIYDGEQRIRTWGVGAVDTDGLQLDDKDGNLGVFIEDGGQVGVGTDSPETALHVVGDASITGDLYLGGQSIEHVTRSEPCWSSLTLTTSYQAITGCTTTLDKLGSWLVAGTVDYQTSTNDQGSYIIAQLHLDGVKQGGELIYYSEIDSTVWHRATMSRTWIVSVTDETTLAELKAAKSGGTGTSYINATHSTLHAVWLGQ